MNVVLWLDAVDGKLGSWRRRSHAVFPEELCVRGVRVSLQVKDKLIGLGPSAEDATAKDQRPPHTDTLLAFFLSSPPLASSSFPCTAQYPSRRSHRHHKLSPSHLRTVFSSQMPPKRQWRCTTQRTKASHLNHTLFQEMSPIYAKSEPPTAFSFSTCDRKDTRSWSSR